MSAPAVSSPPPMPSRPSDDRRKCLMQELSVPQISNFFPIERYYDAADKVYESFEEVHRRGRLDDAYVYGKRFCLFCVDAIPNHNYYDSPKYAAHKRRSERRVSAVIEALERIVELMDAEELERQRQRLEQERIEALRVEKERQDRLDQFQRSYYEQQQGRRNGVATSDALAEPSSSSSSSSSRNVQASAMSKLERLNLNGAAAASSIRRDPSGEPPMNNNNTNAKPSTCRYRMLDDSDDEYEPANGVLPPPIPPPPVGGAAPLPPPPSYEQIRSSGGSLGRDFLGPAKPSSPEHANAPASPPKSKRKLQLPIRSLKDQHRNDYLRYVDKGHIRVSCLNTYQGRVNASTNGCTVISALVAANHMIKQDAGSITTDEVTHIIDNVCGPLLRKIRSKLGLPAHALLIPSDVHDQLVDDKVLSQDVFEGASGGSVLDDDHLGEFLKLLSVGESGHGAHSKAAATFFFREHVISIVKYQNPHRQICYDLIDSLPTVIEGRTAATRTRCASLDALRALLNWYCSRKFSDANCAYIDANNWDDGMADFDPRVFQGFVWMSKPQ